MKITNQQYLSLREIPVLLNRLYIPVINKGKPAIVKNRKAKDFVKYVYMEALRHRLKILEGDITVTMDILICKRKNYDIDGILKLLFDGLEGVAYKNDKQIVDLRIRKHLKADRDGIDILIGNVEEYEQLDDSLTIGQAFYGADGIKNTVLARQMLESGEHIITYKWYNRSKTRWEYGAKEEYLILLMNEKIKDEKN